MNPGLRILIRILPGSMIFYRFFKIAREGIFHIFQCWRRFELYVCFIVIIIIAVVNSPQSSSSLLLPQSLSPSQRQSTGTHGGVALGPQLTILAGHGAEHTQYRMSGKIMKTVFAYNFKIQTYTGWRRKVNTRLHFHNNFLKSSSVMMVFQADTYMHGCPLLYRTSFVH